MYIYICIHIYSYTYICVCIYIYDIYILHIIYIYHITYSTCVCVRVCIKFPTMLFTSAQGLPATDGTFWSPPRCLQRWSWPWKQRWWCPAYNSRSSPTSGWKYIWKYMWKYIWKHIWKYHVETSTDGTWEGENSPMFWDQRGKQARAIDVETKRTAKRKLCGFIIVQLGDPWKWREQNMVCSHQCFFK